jgi:outer membrane receptor protein involved in Fe transport
LTPNPAGARDSAVSIAIPPGNLTDALASLAAQTGISFGYDATLPPIRVRGISGRMSAHEAIDRLLRDTPIKAVRIGPMAFRLIRRQHPPREGLRGPALAVDDPSPAPDIVITGRKLPEMLSRVPAPIAVYVPGTGNRAGADSGQREVARAIDGLVVAGRGEGSDRAFIRGLADSPFNGFSQTIVSVQIDDGRITYDAPEPALRLVDVARVEVLKGPQGPLYGTGALGGVYRIVTNRPILGDISGNAAFSLNTLSKGGPGGSAEATLNLPLVTDSAAVRLVGYAALNGGWIDDRPAPRDANQKSLVGARASLRVAPAAGWSIDLMGTVQDRASRDSQYVYRAGEDLARPATMREPSATHFKLAQARAEGPIGRLQMVIAASQAWQDQSDIYDLSMAPGVLGVPGATAWRDRRSYRVFDQEVRLTSAPGDRFAWTTGLSYLVATTKASGDAQIAPGEWGRYFELHRHVTEAAMFLDGSLPIGGRVTLAGGFRVFRSSIEDERTEPAVPTASARGLTGFTPNLSLSYDLGRTGTIYARIATAFRPGGIDPGNARTGRYQADEVRNIDVGARLRLAGDRLALDTAIYLAQWRDMQSDYLEPNGLIATRNAGDAAVAGFEGALDWRPGPQWRFKLGMTLQRARLYNSADATGVPDDRRLPLTPDIAYRLTAERTVRWRGRDFRPYAGINFIGSTRLSFDNGLDRRMDGYAIVRAGASTTIGPVEARIDVDNLFDTRADTFAYGNPFSVRSTPQFTPLRPRTFSLTLSRDF